MKLFRTPRALVFGAAAALLLAGCAGTAGTTNEDDANSDLPPGVSVRGDGAQILERNEPVYGGTITVALDGGSDTLDPLLNSTIRGFLLGAIYDPLVTYDETTKNIEGYLAESLESDDDGKTWLMKLRSGVKFHDGTDFNADAVAAHFARMGSEESRSGAAKDARNITTRVVDDLTLELTLEVPNPQLPALLTTAGLTTVPSPTAVDALGSDFGLRPVGTGPFMVESFLPGSTAKVVRNPNYWQEGLPYLDAIEFVTAVDNQSRVAAVIAGDIDIASWQSAVDMQKVREAGLTVLRQPAYNYFNIVFSMSKPPFDDVRFRKAVIQGIDLNALNQVAFGGEHNVMTGLFPSDSPFYVDSDWPSYDPEAAKQLIDEWVADTGNAPAFELTAFAPADFQKQAAMVQQMMEDIGVDMRVSTGEQATMVSEAFADNYTAQFRWTTIAPEVTQVLTNEYHSASGLNITHSGDPEVDALLDEARMLTDAAERAAVYEKIQKRFAEWLPMIPTIQQVYGFSVSDRIGGFNGVFLGSARPDLRDIFIAD